jgi:hypothetical protein
MEVHALIIVVKTILIIRKKLTTTPIKEKPRDVVKEKPNDASANFFNSVGKSMVRWLTFDIWKSPHLTLTTIPAFKIIIKL